MNNLQPHKIKPPVELKVPLVLLFPTTNRRAYGLWRPILMKRIDGWWYLNMMRRRGFRLRKVQFAGAAPE